MEQKVKTISDLKHDTHNPRLHNERNLKVIVDSLQSVGFARSIVIDENNEILAGNGVTEAAVIAGIEKVIEVEADGNTIIAVRRRGLTDEQKQKLKYYDNRSGELAGWDTEVVFADMTAGFDFSGIFNQDELDAMFVDVAPESPEPSDAAPQTDKAAELLEKWKVQVGDLWRIGDHRLACGDCTDVATVARVMGGEKAQSIVTSPPYNQSLDSFRPSGMQKESPSFVNRMASSYSDSMPENEYQEWQKTLLRLWKGFVTENGSCFYNHKIRYRDKAIISPITWLVDCGWTIRQEIIWDRGSSITLNARMFIPADERIYWLRAGDDFLFNDTPDIKAWTTVWEIAAKNDVQISAAFATEIPTRCVTASTNAGDIVAEPFAGSGTTIVACQNLQRKARAIELSPAYCSVILQRMSDAFPDLPIERVS